MSIDPQDPLPEGRWVWRRAFIWSLTIAACWQLHRLVERLQTDTALLEAALALIWLIGGMATLYLVAPSFEQITRLVQAAKLRVASVVENAAAALNRRDAP